MVDGSVVQVIESITEEELGTIQTVALQHVTYRLPWKHGNLKIAMEAEYFTGWVSVNIKHWKMARMIDRCEIDWYAPHTPV